MFDLWLVMTVMRTRHLARALRQIAADGSAATAGEVAGWLPLFAGLVFTITQVGLYFYYSASLFRVTQASARQILTGSVANQNLTAAQFQSQILCPQLPGNMSCNNVI